MEKVRLGRVDQWIVIRGKNANNPVLLFLSGGPGRLPEADPRTEAAVYFATGRYDLSDMAVLTERYYQALKNTQKHLVWFEASGHAPIYEQTPEFLNFMVNTILANTGR